MTEVSPSEVREQALAKFGHANLNQRLSNQRELRFGKQGSKSVKLETGAWFDHEAGEGGYFSAPVEVPAINYTRMIVRKYDYHDADGELHMQVCRYMPKDFRPRRPDPNNPGKWILSIKGIETVPYRLPEMLESDYVVIVEGEKDADRLADLGIVATTNIGGAGNWRPELAQYFKGKRVYIIPDNDQAGRDRVPTIVENLFPVADQIRVCDLCKDMPPKSDVSDWLDLNLCSGNELTTKVLDAGKLVEDPVEDVIDEGNVFELLAADDIQASLATDDFVEGVLISGAMSVLYGPSNCGKTFFASDLALHVALGWRWRDKEVEQGGVIYIAAEGAHGIKNRVAAFKKHHGLVEGVPLAVLPSTVNMSDPAGDIDKLVNTVRLAKNRFGRIALVVVDTLARVMTGNENTAEDMGALINNCDRLRHVTNAHVMLIHHSGKAKEAGARGSSALRAATDTEIEIDKHGMTSTATVTKQRELEISGVFHFTLDVVELGTNPRGKSVTSCIVKEVESSAARIRDRKPTGKQQKLVYAVAKQLLADGIQQQVFGVDGPIVATITEAELRHSSYERMSNDAKHKSTAFNRALDGLVGDEFLMKKGDLIWAI